MGSIPTHDQRAAGRQCKERRYDLVDTYAAEHDIRAFAQRFEKKTSDSVPCQNRQSVAAWPKYARPKRQKSYEAQKPPTHFQNLHRNAQLSHSTRALKPAAQQGLGFAPGATAVENEPKTHPEPPARHA